MKQEPKGWRLGGFLLACVSLGLPYLVLFVREWQRKGASRAVKKYGLLFFISLSMGGLFQVEGHFHIVKRAITRHSMFSSILQRDLENETIEVLPPKGERQFWMAELDHLGRATSAHIQLKAAYRPQEKRAERIQVDPVGWHNYRFYYGDGSQKSWLMHRGHLVAYTFSGVNDDLRNLVPMTVMLNIGDYQIPNSHNPQAMLYYETALSHWLNQHPQYWLDYCVQAIYEGDEKIPRYIELQYVGLDDDGHLIPIALETELEQVDKRGVHHVRLANISPNAQLNYQEGTAVNTIKKARGL